MEQYWCVKELKMKMPTEKSNTTNTQSKKQNKRNNMYDTDKWCPSVYINSVIIFLFIFCDGNVESDELLLPQRIASHLPYAMTISLNHWEICQESSTRKLQYVLHTWRSLWKKRFQDSTIIFLLFDDDNPKHMHLL